MTDSGEPLLIAVTQITWHLGNIFTVKTTGIYELYAQTCINDEANAVVFCDALTSPLRVSDQKMNIRPKMWKFQLSFCGICMRMRQRFGATFEAYDPQSQTKEDLGGV